MTISVTNPADIRTWVAGFLETDLVGAGKPAQAVYDYEADDFAGQSPVVLVASAGDDLQRRTASERVKGNVWLEIMSFVLYRDTASNWTPADCEARLNLLKQKIMESIFDNQFSMDTRMIFIDGRSQILPANVGGANYRMETTPVKVQVFDG